MVLLLLPPAPLAVPATLGEKLRVPVGVSLPAREALAGALPLAAAREALGVRDRVPVSEGEEEAEGSPVGLAVDSPAKLALAALLPLPAATEAEEEGLCCAVAEEASCREGEAEGLPEPPPGPGAESVGLAVLQALALAPWEGVEVPVGLSPALGEAQGLALPVAVGGGERVKQAEGVGGGWGCHCHCPRHCCWRCHPGCHCPPPPCQWLLPGTECSRHCLCCCCSQWQRRWRWGRLCQRQHPGH